MDYAKESLRLHEEWGGENRSSYPGPRCFKG